MANEPINPKLSQSESESEEEETEEAWDDWQAEEDESWGPHASLICLFCTDRFDCSESLFKHCTVNHCFDFDAIVKDFGLDFYGSLKLINYVRSKVSENKCWGCNQAFESKQEMQNHLREISTCINKDEKEKYTWNDDFFLKPFLEEDALLHSLSMFDFDEEEESSITMNREEIMKEIGGAKLPNLKDLGEEFENLVMENGAGLEGESSERKLKVVREGVASRQKKDVDETYFGSYGSFGIHREMLGDKERMDAYRNALLNNPSLVKNASVLDVGCGTGILSLFAAKAGASRVVSVEASAKMASVATQIAKDNDCRVMTVVQSMVEEIEKHLPIEPQSFDVLVSEWMGYCLLYECMLSSVIYARDKFLKPGGAILPDTASIFGAGFGKGGTGMEFWENVCGFDMSCIGKELVQNAAQLPIVDSIDPCHIITDTALLKAFDLVTMKQEDMDFTSTMELKLKPSNTNGNTVWCHGIVLWFDTGFTSRFCKENPTNLSTSPYGPQTHWMQTILTFKEPIAMCNEKGKMVISEGKVGTDECPVVGIRARISIIRAWHRSIDISVEVSGFGSNGKKRDWQVQMFNL
ncbi:hypothetical protein LUZ60_014113 [Juncus effusus]|nr:hypothetical protein LUZ60_014113 [Juncus effusus]